MRVKGPAVVVLGALLMARPAMYSIPLDPTTTGRGASGVAMLARPDSPFGMPVTRDGHVVYDVSVTVHGLPPAGDINGATTYVAWATVPDLSLVRRIGALSGDSVTRGEVAWNKFIVLVTAEKGGTGERWGGPILLKGSSPSTWMQRFQAHVTGNGGNPDF